MPDYDCGAVKLPNLCPCFCSLPMITQLMGHGCRSFAAALILWSVPTALEMCALSEKKTEELVAAYLKYVNKSFGECLRDQNQPCIVYVMLCLYYNQCIHTKIKCNKYGTKKGLYSFDSFVQFCSASHTLLMMTAESMLSKRPVLRFT